MEQRVTYTLDWYGTIYKDESIERSLFSDAIIRFGDEDDYIVLESNVPIQNSAYIQAHSPYKKGSKLVVVEIRIGSSEDKFRHYKYETEDKEEVISMFLKYWAKQEIPDISTWEDITKEFL